MFKRFAIAATAAIGLASCSAGQNIAAGEQSVDQFHRAYNDGRYGELYTGATQDLTGTATPQAWNELLANVKSQMGNVRSSQRNGFNVNYNNGTSSVELTYDTEFERGRANESFVFRMNGDRAQLAGYRYNRTSGGSAAPTAPAQPAAPPADQPVPPPPADAPAGDQGDKSAEQ